MRFFERRREEAHRSRLVVFERLRRDGIGTAALPDDYVDAMTRTFDLVWRSR